MLFLDQLSENRVIGTLKQLITEISNKSQCFIANFSHKNAQNLVFWAKIDDKYHHFLENFQLYKTKILTNFGKTDELTDLTVLMFMVIFF